MMSLIHEQLRYIGPFRSDKLPWDIAYTLHTQYKHYWKFEVVNSVEFYVQMAKISSHKVSELRK